MLENINVSLDVILSFLLQVIVEDIVDMLDIVVEIKDFVVIENIVEFVIVKEDKFQEELEEEDHLDLLFISDFVDGIVVEDSITDVLDMF